MHCRNHVSQVLERSHERRSSRTERIADGHLRVAEPLGQEVERQHLRVVVVVDDLRMHRGGRGSARNPLWPSVSGTLATMRRPAVRARLPNATARQHPPDLTAKPAADDVVGMPGDDRFDQAGELFGCVFAIGVGERDRDRGERVHRMAESHSHCRAEAAVLGHDHDMGPGLRGHERQWRRSNRRRSRRPRRGGRTPLAALGQ